MDNRRIRRARRQAHRSLSACARWGYYLTEHMRRWCYRNNAWLRG